MRERASMRLVTRSANLALIGFVFGGCSAATVDSDSDDETFDQAPISSVAQPVKLDHQPDPARELFITALSAVNSVKHVNYRPGKWNTDEEGGFSFGRLIDNMSRVEKPTAAQRSNFVMSWLRTWEVPQTVNGQSIPARPLIRSTLITPWKLASIGREGNTATTCSADAATDFTCKLSFAPDVVPFRLLAVVYRPDLRRVPPPNAAHQGSAGQGRFVFGVLDQARQPAQFTVIFEYMIPTSGKSDIQAVADKWHKLGKLPLGSDHTKALHANTLQFTKWNIAPLRNNGSALLQIRTNEVSLAEPGSDPTSSRGLLWEMREFIVGSSGALVPDTMKQEPPLALSGTPILSEWVTANSARLLDGSYEIPESYAGQPFLAASSLVPSTFRWDVPGVATGVRNAFALGTCNGCHRNETATPFLHVKTRLPDAPAALSNFLTNELAATGPRVADFKSLLSVDFSAIQDGKGKGHADDEDDEDDD